MSLTSTVIAWQPIYCLKGWVGWWLLRPIHAMPIAWMRQRQRARAAKAWGYGRLVTTAAAEIQANYELAMRASGRSGVRLPK